MSMYVLLTAACAVVRGRWSGVGFSGEVDRCGKPRMLGPRSAQQTTNIAANNRSGNRGIIIQYETMKPEKAQLPSRSLSLPYRRNALIHTNSAT